MYMNEENLTVYEYNKENNRREISCVEKINEYVVDFLTRTSIVAC